MSVRSFRSVGWVAGVAATALGCYMVNLKVASERASLEDVETRIVLAQRDIRVLQTEIGTRGRLDQLEKWNVRVLALSAPQANQFLEGGFQLASLTAPKKVIDPAAPVVLASAPALDNKPELDSDGAPVESGPTASDLMHVASLKRGLKPAEAPKQKSVEKPELGDKEPAAAAAKPAKARLDSAAKAEGSKSADRAKPTAKPELAEKPKSKSPTAKPREVASQQ